MEPASKLVELPNGAKLDTVGETINENYLRYHILTIRLEGLQNWINIQKKLYEDNKNGS